MLQHCATIVIVNCFTKSLMIANSCKENIYFVVLIASARQISLQHAYQYASNNGRNYWSVLSRAHRVTMACCKKSNESRIVKKIRNKNLIPKEAASTDIWASYKCKYYLWKLTLKNVTRIRHYRRIHETSFLDLSVVSPGEK
jgi:hypothetical protein